MTSPALENMRVHVARTSEKVATVDAHTLPSYMVIIYIGCMDTGIRPSDATGFGRDEHNVLKNWGKHEVTNRECEEAFYFGFVRLGLTHLCA